MKSILLQDLKQNVDNGFIFGEYTCIKNVDIDVLILYAAEFIICTVDDKANIFKYIIALPITTPFSKLP